jgi:hypothetical protein
MVLSHAGRAARFTIEGRPAFTDTCRQQSFHPAIGQEYASNDGGPHCSGRIAYPERARVEVPGDKSCPGHVNLLRNLHPEAPQGSPGLIRPDGRHFNAYGRGQGPGEKGRLPTGRRMPSCPTKPHSTTPTRSWLRTEPRALASGSAMAPNLAVTALGHRRLLQRRRHGDARRPSCVAHALVRAGPMGHPRPARLLSRDTSQVLHAVQLAQ